MWDVAIVITFIGTALILAYITTKFSNEHIFLKFIFFFFTLFIFIMSLSFVGGLATQNNTITTVSIIYYVLIVITIVTMIYFGIFFIYKNAKARKAREREAQGLEEET